MTNSSILNAFERFWEHVTTALDKKSDIGHTHNITCPINLLDNSDFRNPVNQNGKTSYSGSGYTIDRWFMEYGYSVANVALNDGCLTFSIGAYQNALRQNIAIGTLKEGKTYTFAVKTISGDLHICSGILNRGNMLSAYKYFPLRSEDGGYIAFGWSDSNNFPYVRIHIGDTNSGISIEWAALYEGEYTAETLPEYQPKGYENELLVCGQYDISTGEYIGLRKFVQSTPRNLLDNSDFTNPVNQRGFVSGTTIENGYFIDRWRDDYLGITPTLSTSGITANSGTFLQLTKNLRELVGQKITVCCGLSDESIVVCSGIVGDGREVASTTQFDVRLDCYYFENDSWVVSIAPNGKTIKWAALYEGEYTAGTLPEYQPKGYATELAECRRYYQRYEHFVINCVSDGSKKASAFFYLPTQMRIIPTVTFSTTYDGSVFGGPLVLANGSFYGIYSLSQDYNSKDHINFSINGTNSGAIVEFKTDLLELNAELL